MARYGRILSRLFKAHKLIFSAHTGFWLIFTKTRLWRQIWPRENPQTIENQGLFGIISITATRHKKRFEIVRFQSVSYLQVYMQDK